MKNNEILITVSFNCENKKREMAFLVVKDISLGSLIEAIYFGLKKHKKEKIQSEEALTNEECFSLFDKYIRTHSEIVILYNADGKHNVINLAQKSQKEDYKEKFNYEIPISALGIVTSSCVYITDK